MSNNKTTERQCERKTVEVKHGGSVTLQPSQRASTATNKEDPSHADKA